MSFDVEAKISELTEEKQELQKFAELFRAEKKKLNLPCNFKKLLSIWWFTVPLGIVSFAIAVILIALDFKSSDMESVFWGSLIGPVVGILSVIATIILYLIICAAGFFLICGITYFIIYIIRNSREKTNAFLNRKILDIEFEIKRCDNEIAKYRHEIKELEQKRNGNISDSEDESEDIPDEDDLPNETTEFNYGALLESPEVRLAMEYGKISCPMMQRILKLSRNEAEKRLAALQEMGIVGPPNGNHQHKIMVTQEELIEMSKRG